MFREYLKIIRIIVKNSSASFGTVWSIYKVPFFHLQSSLFEMFEKKKAETSLYHDEKLSRSPQDLETYLKKINRMLVFNIKLAKKNKD